jgi:2-(1,2-epoxy-1,2-dihydrophenyl)acetyl-CoA isomerase
MRASKNAAEVFVPDLVTTTDRGHVRTITLNRPEKKNALSQQLAWGIVEAIDAAARDDNVWVVALTGAGDTFCAGLDLTGSATYSPHSPLTAQLDDVGWVGNFLLAARERCNKPIVAGINGAAVGAGLGLAMSADIRIVARGARLMAGYTRIGASPDAGLSITLPQAMGYERAMRFMLENRTAMGDDAVTLGLAGEAVDDDKLQARLAEYCDQLCTWSPVTMRLLKRVMVQSMTSTDMRQQLRYEVANIRFAFASEDSKEARVAFLEKRKPVFKGR